MTTVAALSHLGGRDNAGRVPKSNLGRLEFDEEVASSGAHLVAAAAVRVQESDDGASP